MSTRLPISRFASLATAAATAVLVVQVQGCSSAAPMPVVPPPAPAQPSPTPPLPTASTYWAPVDATVRGNVLAPGLPLGESQVTIGEGVAARWKGLSPEARAAILEHGFAVVARATPSDRFGESYAALGDARVPYVVTLDALFWVVHVARDRALASAEQTALGPALDTLLRRLETRLADDARTAPSDLLAAYALARGVVAVASALLSPEYRPPADLARVVAEELTRITAHERPSVSPLLGLTVDYSQIVPRGAADTSSARAAYARAVAWLGMAPFAVAAQGEIPGAEIQVGRARVHARAALLIARILQFDVDAEAALALRRFTTVSEFAGGASDDVTLHQLLVIADAVGIDTRDPRAFADVVKIDRLRHKLLTGPGSKLADGSASLGVRSHLGVPVSPADYPRAAMSVRILPARSAPDADVLQSLVFPSVGKLQDHAGAPPPTARDGVRAMPRALDVAAWLGAPDARALLHASGDDAYERYGAAFAALDARRLPASAQHDSVYGSSLDAIATFLGKSASDAAIPAASTAEWRARKLETSLAAWTTLRHDALPFARFPLATAPTGSPAHPPGVRTASAFIEPHVEAIGRLLSLARQTTHGLRALSQIPEGASAIPLLDASERLLSDAFAIAKREADDEVLTEDEHAAMESFPTRLVALEEALVPSHAADATLAVDVHADLTSSRVLEEACGDLDDLYLVVREPHTGRLVLAVGAASSHYELAAPERDRLTDATFHAKLHGPTPPPRDAFAPVFAGPVAPGETGAALESPLDAGTLSDAQPAR